MRRRIVHGRDVVAQHPREILDLDPPDELEPERREIADKNEIATRERLIGHGRAIDRDRAEDLAGGMCESPSFTK
jgi:hypothetical protein